MNPTSIKIDLLIFQEKLTTKEEDGKQWIFDPIRKKYLVLLPEELVRQLLLQYLIEIKKFPAGRINVEKQLTVLSSKRRFDMVIYDKNANPKMLIECKAPNVKINQKTFEQIAKYNLSIQADYLLVTNGIETFCCKMDYQNKSYSFISEIPDFFSKK